MKKLAAALALALFASPLLAQDVTEEKSGTKFTAKRGDQSLLGTGLRKKAFFKVYAIGLYVSDAALQGPLKAHKGKPTLQAEIINGDFERTIQMKFLRDVSQDRIRGAFRETLEQADKTKLEGFLSYFGETKEGQEYLLHWVAGGALEVTVAGVAKPPITDKTFAGQVLGIWLGATPIQDDIKQGLVSRQGQVIP
jgi:hypothetical protein